MLFEVATTETFEYLEIQGISWELYAYFSKNVILKTLNHLIAIHYDLIPRTYTSSFKEVENKI